MKKLDTQINSVLYVLGLKIWSKALQCYQICYQFLKKQFLENSLDSFTWFLNEIPSVSFVKNIFAKVCLTLFGVSLSYILKVGESPDISCCTCVRLNMLLVASCSLLFAYCSLLFARCSLLFDRCSLIFARYSLLFARCLLIFARYSLLFARC